MYILTILFINLVTFVIINLVSSEKTSEIKFISAFGAGLAFLCSLYLFVNFNYEYPRAFQFTFVLNLFRPVYLFGVDGLSVVFLLGITATLFFVFVYFNLNKHDTLGFILLELFSVGYVSTTDLLVLFLFFEGILIPMYLLVEFIGLDRTKPYNENLVISLVITSFLFVGCLFFIYARAGTFCFELYISQFSFKERLIFWHVAFFYFVRQHVHPITFFQQNDTVKQPTAQALLLSSFALRLKIYGPLRLGFLMFPSTMDFFWFIMSVVILGTLIWVAVTALFFLDTLELKFFEAVQTHFFLSIHVSFTYCVGIFYGFTFTDGALHLIPFIVVVLMFFFDIYACIIVSKKSNIVILTRELYVVLFISVLDISCRLVYFISPLL